MKLSVYNPNDADRIKQLFIETFSESESPSEGELIGKLVRNFLANTDKSDFYCFIAADGGAIIGAIFFSRITFESDINTFILAPVAVRTDFQNKGIAQNLIRFGLNALSKEGVALALTYGDPAFYCKVGFQVVSEEKIPAPLVLSYPEGWMAQSLSDDEIQSISGSSSCVEALNDPAYW